MDLPPEELDKFERFIDKLQQNDSSKATKRVEDA